MCRPPTIRTFNYNYVETVLESSMALFNLHNPYEREEFKRYVNTIYNELVKAPLGIVEIKKKHLKRSKSQNSYLHVCLGYYASEFGYSLDEVKQDIFKRQINSDIFEVERKNKRGQTVKRLRSSTDLDTKEMTTAIERFRNWSSAVAGLYIPAPNETEALFAAQKQMEQYEQYL